MARARAANDAFGDDQVGRGVIVKLVLTVETENRRADRAFEYGGGSVEVFHRYKRSTAAVESCRGKNTLEKELGEKPYWPFRRPATSSTRPIQRSAAKPSSVIIGAAPAGMSGHEGSSPASETLDRIDDQGARDLAPVDENPPTHVKMLGRPDPAKVEAHRL